MPRIIQLTPDGGGRYIAVDRDGDLWRGETKRQKDGGEEYILWSRCPRSSRGIADRRADVSAMRWR